MAGRRVNRGEHSVAVFKNRNDTVRGGKDTSGNDELNSDSEEDWIHSSEYEEYSRLIEQMNILKTMGIIKKRLMKMPLLFYR